MRVTVRQLRRIIREQAEQLDLPGIESPAFSQGKLDKANERLRQARGRLTAAKTETERATAGRAFQQALADVQSLLQAQQGTAVQPSLKTVYGGDTKDRGGLGT